jgi:hypothetical protein
MHGKNVAHWWLLVKTPTTAEQRRNGGNLGENTSNADIESL